MYGIDIVYIYIEREIGDEYISLGVSKSTFKRDVCELPSFK